MQELIISIMNQFGYLGIAALIAIENIFPPIPSEIVLTFGGFMTTFSEMNIVGVIIASTIGSVLGAIVLYLVGRIFKKERLQKIVEGKIGRILRFKKEDIDKAEEWFSKRGKKTVFFCRFIPIIRSLISIPAGMTEMKFIPFLVLTTLGSIIWNTVLTVLGKVAGDSWGTVSEVIDKYSKVTLVILIIVFIIAAVIFYKKRKKE